LRAAKTEENKNENPISEKEQKSSPINQIIV
jgi:hypothetical protein